MKKTIYDLELHEVLEVDRYLTYRRVPGGWIVTVATATATNGSIIATTAMFLTFYNELNPAYKGIAPKIPLPNPNAPLASVNLP
jgi:hypothetical protein